MKDNIDCITKYRNGGEKMQNINDVFLSGTIKEIAPSHVIDGVEFSKAKLICKRDNGQEDVINLRFKSFSNHYSENDEISLKGNIRSYSHKTEDGRNKVTIYVFTYFDESEDNFEGNNVVHLTGRICKMNELRRTRNNKNNIHFIVANNLVSGDSGKRLNSYIPCIAWGNLAVQLSSLTVNDKVELIGRLHSREHTKTYENGKTEIRVAHELLIDSFEVLE